MQKRILHIITGLNDGGAEAVLYRLCAFDGAHRHAVVSMMDAGKYGALLEERGVAVTCLGMPQGHLTLNGLWRLWRLLRDEHFDLVQTWMYHADLVGGLISWLGGVRRVFWGIHNSTLVKGKSRRSTMVVVRVNAWLSRWIPTGIVCCAERAREVHLALGYAASKLVVVFNGYDLSQFRPDESARLRLRQKWGLDDDIPLLGMVGRFDPMKDHQNLIAALGQLKRTRHAFRCVLVGSGMEKSNNTLMKLLEEHDVSGNVLLLGQRSDVPWIMNALDIHVLSSSAEAFPNVLAEAMACGTPCVTTDVGDAALIVGDTGWVVPASDATQLAGAIIAALAARRLTDEWRLRCEAARRRMTERFSLEQMVAGYHAVWGQQ